MSGVAPGLLVIQIQIQAVWFMMDLNKTFFIQKYVWKKIIFLHIWCHTYTYDLSVKYSLLTLKNAGGADTARSSGDRLPFLTGSCYGHKNSWLYPQTSQLEGTKVIFWLSGQVFQKFSRDRWKITIFLERKSQNRLFFNFFITKVSYFISNLNDDFHEASFEVYSVSQKSVIFIIFA